MRLLRLAILGAFPLLAALNTSTVEADTHSLEEIVVYGYDVDGPLFLGPNFNTEGDDYSFDYGSNGGSGDIDNYDGPTPESCALLAAAGRPDGCTRFVAESYDDPNSVDRPVLPEITQWASQNMQNGAHVHYQYLQWSANSSLAACYANPANDPDQCEAAWVNALDVCDAWSNQLFGQDANGIQCDLGFAAVQERAEVANDSRLHAEWLAYFSGVPVPRLGVDVNLPLGQWYLQANPMNRLYIWMRRGDNCMRWFDLWDDQNCSSYYPNA